MLEVNHFVSVVGEVISVAELGMVCGNVRRLGKRAQPVSSGSPAQGVLHHPHFGMATLLGGQFWQGALPIILSMN